MNSELKDFVRRALELKASREQIATVLKKAGWGAAEISAALGAFAEIDFVTPAPKRQPYLSARQTFIYLVMFSALYRTLWDIGSLAFTYIDSIVPDPAFTHKWGVADELRWRIASLTVAFPLFCYAFWLIERDIRSDPLQAESQPRKWFTYLTLLLATLTLVCDLAYLVYGALGGELGLRIILKLLVVAVLAGGTFFYFINEMRHGERQ